MQRFDGEITVVVARYDRLHTDANVVRLHQEDMCQALGIAPIRKYENEGGPGVQPIAELLRTHSQKSTDDIWTFVDALALNWVIGGTDAHAKNYSVLIGAGGQVRLSPLYDVASALPNGLDIKKLRLAMKIGGKYHIDDIAGRHWDRLAKSIRLREDAVRARCRDLATRLPDALADVIQKATADGLDPQALQRLAQALGSRVGHCLRMLDSIPAAEAL